MAGEVGSVQIQDDDSNTKASVVATDDDPTIMGLVVVNPDGSDIG